MDPHFFCYDIHMCVFMSGVIFDSRWEKKKYTCLQTYFDIGIFIDISCPIIKNQPLLTQWRPQWLPVHISWVPVRVSIVAERAREGPLGGAMACDKKLLRMEINLPFGKCRPWAKTKRFGKSQGFCRFQVQAMVSGFLCSQLQWFFTFRFTLKNAVWEKGPGLHRRGRCIEASTSGCDPMFSCMYVCMYVYIL